MTSLPDLKPLVSVILPIYNGAEFVGTALDSVLSQTWTNLEVIAVDDGSTDNSLEVLRAYAAEDSRVRVIAQGNGGVARARNHAISEARGEYIAPLDADDMWIPTKIERQVEVMLSAGSQTGLVYSWWVWIDESGVVLDRSPQWRIEGDTFELLLQINFTGNSSVPLYRKSYAIEVGAYNEELRAAHAGGCEDWDLVLRIAAKYKVAFVPQILVGYRRTSGSMSTAYAVMNRSHKCVMQTMRALRPDVAEAVFQSSDRQFAMYLAGLAFWGGNLLQAIGWGLQSGWRLPLSVAPHLFRLLAARNRLTMPNRSRELKGQIMLPGYPLQAENLGEPLIPYDQIYLHQSKAPSANL